MAVDPPHGCGVVAFFHKVFIIVGREGAVYLGFGCVIPFAETKLALGVGVEAESTLSDGEGEKDSVAVVYATHLGSCLWMVVVVAVVIK